MSQTPPSPADRRALDAMLAVRPVWRRLVRAGEAVGLEAKVLLHAGPAFASPAEITRPILNSARVAAVFEGLAADFDAAERALLAGGIVLRPAQDFGVVPPLAAVVSASMWLHEVVDGAGGAARAHSPINGGNGPAMRLGLCSEAVLRHLRWLNGAFAENLRQAQTADIDLIDIAAEALRKGDDCHGRTVAGTAELTRRLGPPIDSMVEARAFLEAGPSFFLNLWMAACGCMSRAARGTPGSSLVTAAGANGRDTGIQVAGLPGRWFTAPAAAPKGDLGDHPPARALGAIGDSAIVDACGFGAMALSYAPAQRPVLGPYLPADGLARPLELLAAVHPGFGELGFRTGLLASRVAQTGKALIVSLGILDKEGLAGRLGGGIFESPLSPFAAAAKEIAA